MQIYCFGIIKNQTHEQLKDFITEVWMFAERLLTPNSDDNNSSNTSTGTPCIELFKKSVAALCFIWKHAPVAAC